MQLHQILSNSFSGFYENMCACRSRMMYASFIVSMPPPEEDPKKFGKHAGLRLKELEKHMSSLHSKHAPGPHWYAWVLATDPSFSRQGAASALVRAILAMCTQARGGIQLYLECANDNVPFYRDKLGMRAIGSVVMENPDPEGEGPAESFAMMSELMS
jgi:ribosomal protein S18 acetylase RimI-like enzyme